MTIRSFVQISHLLPVIFLLLLGDIAAQNSPKTTVDIKLTGEYRDNITRQPDSLKNGDVRSNFLGFVEHQRKIFSDVRWRSSYELRYHRYSSEHEFDRHAHLLRTSVNKSLTNSVKFSASDEYRLRLHPSAKSIDHRRNILDVALRFPFIRTTQLTAGYQNWAKSYPNSTLFQNYSSHRFYAKLNWGDLASTNIGIKGSRQYHRGNLFPGSTAPNQTLNLRSTRLAWNLTLDKLLGRKYLVGLAYRYEDDEPDESDFEREGENLDDEEIEDLLADDADFGYIKHQLSLSTLLKLNERISIITFYAFQNKTFEFWRIRSEGPIRRDKLLFLSNLIKVKAYKDFGLQLQYNFENKRTNLDAYRYRSNTISFGFFWNR